MPKIKIYDPANIYHNRNGWHELYGSSADALNGNISRIFLTGIPQSVPNSSWQQDTDYTCGPSSMAIALNQANDSEAHSWLASRGLITSTYGTSYEGIVGYLGAKGYNCSYDGIPHDGEMTGFDAIENHLRSGYKVILCMHHPRTNYWTNGGHYIVAAEIEGGSGSKITVDGSWGKATTSKAQAVFGTSVDGIVSRQYYKNSVYLEGCITDSWEFVEAAKVGNGSDLIRAIQKKIGAWQDGVAGVEFVQKLQKFLGVTVDGKFGKQSVSALQTWLNNQ